MAMALQQRSVSAMWARRRAMAPPRSRAMIARRSASCSGIGFALCALSGKNRRRRAAKRRMRRRHDDGWRSRWSWRALTARPRPRAAEWTGKRPGIGFTDRMPTGRRGCRLARLQSLAALRQHRPLATAALCPGTEPHRERLGLPAGQPPRHLSLRDLRRSRRRMLRCPELLRKRRRHRSVHHNATAYQNGQCLKPLA